MTPAAEDGCIPGWPPISPIVWWSSYDRPAGKRLKTIGSLVRARDAVPHSGRRSRRLYAALCAHPSSLGRLDGLSRAGGRPSSWTCQGRGVRRAFSRGDPAHRTGIRLCALRQPRVRGHIPHRPAAGRILRASKGQADSVRRAPRSWRLLGPRPHASRRNSP